MRRDLVDLGTEEIDADDRQIRDRLARLLDQAQHAAVAVENGDPERRRVLNPAQKDLRRTAALAVPLSEANNASAEEVVAQEHAECGVPEPILGGDDRVREPESS